MSQNWNQNQQMLAMLAGQAQSEQTALQNLAAEPIRQGFRNEGQSGWDAISNPDENQRQTLLNIGLGMLGSDPRAAPGQAVADSVSKGLSLMDTMKERSRQQKLGVQGLKVKAAQDQYGYGKDIAGMATKPVEAKRDRFENIEVITGYDEITGAPKVEQRLVNVDQMLREQGAGAGVQRVSTFGGNDAPSTPVAPKHIGEESPRSTLAAEGAQEATTEAVTSGSLSTYRLPPARPGRSVIENTELREKAAVAYVELEALLDDVTHPQLSQVVGWGEGGRLKGALARAVETPELSVLAAGLSQGMKARAIPLAKQLGVNPTDFDYQQIIKSAPTTDDGADVWRDWTMNKYIPMLVAKVRALHGDEYANGLNEVIQKKLGVTAEKPVTVSWEDYK